MTAPAYATTEIPAAEMDAFVARVQREIADSITDGSIPATVTTFDQLHDYVDANEFGGLCDDNDPASEYDLPIVIAMQERVDAWLAAGRPTT